MSTHNDDTSIDDEVPSSVQASVWLRISPTTRMTLKKQHDQIYHPSGIDEKLWRSLDGNTRDEIKNALDGKVVEFEEFYCLGDTSLGTLDVLKRYDSCSKALDEHGARRFFEEGMEHEHHFQDSIVDFALSYAIDGDNYISKIQTALQYIVLQAALVLTISLEQYLHPDIDDDDDLEIFYTYIVGSSAILHLSTIILATIVSASINMAFGGVDRTVVRVKLNFLLILTNVFNYCGDVLMMIGMIVVGSSRSKYGIYSELYVAIFVCFLLCTFMYSMGIAMMFQNRRCIQFYRKYCDHSGQLRADVLHKVYRKYEDEHLVHLHA